MLSQSLFISFRNEVIAQNFAMSNKAINKGTHHVLSDVFEQKNNDDKFYASFTPNGSVELWNFSKLKK